MTKLISWNVNGLRAVCGKGFADIFTDFDADYVCLQETKLQQGQIELEFPGYTSYWNYAEKKGYSGVAVYTRRMPLAVHLGIGRDEHDREGRVLTIEDEDFYLVCCYTPNSQNPDVQGEMPKRLDYRMEWEDAFREYVIGLHCKGLADMVEAGGKSQGQGSPKPVIICGDLNVAHKEIDLKNPKTNTKSAGFTPQEREKMTALLESGFTDTFRYFYPDKSDAYSWWSYRMNSRARNIGWRIDYFLATSDLDSRLEDAAILPEIMGSDHCPVSLVIR
ncbi:MAG: exodeoxyribonuclease III [Candidatus Cryptobacteroides sp.]